MFADDYEIIHQYTRQQALADGTLIDVSETAKEAGIRYLTALTCTVWGSYVEIPEHVEAQDKAGRLWDIVWMLQYAILQHSGGDTILFQLYVRNDNNEPKPVTLKAVCGPDDDGSPCITIMLPSED